MTPPRTTSATTARRPRCTSRSGLLEILRPDLAAIRHLRLTVEALRCSAVALHRPRLIARRPLLPLSTGRIPLVDIPCAIGEDSAGTSARSGHTRSATYSTTGSAAGAIKSRPATRREAMVVPRDNP